MFQRLQPALASLVAALTLPLTVEAQLPPRTPLAISNVTVIPMDAERALRGQTVVIDGQRIAAIGPSDTIVAPANAIAVDGSSRYLIPGLAEMHGHIPRTRGDAEDVLFLYLAGGATLVRGMQGDPVQLEFRRAVRDGEMLGPRLWLAAPAMRGRNVPDVATAERLVNDAKRRGFDLLKIHEGLSADVYAAIARSATEVGLPWGGHVPDSIGVHGALAAGQSTIDHFDNYIDAMQPPGSEALAASGAARQRLLSLNADPAMAEALARATRAAGVAVVPTQSLWETLRGAVEPSALTARDEIRYMPQALRTRWLDSATAAYGRASRDGAAAEAALRQHLLRTMHDQGVTILLGTDAPQVFSVPGFSLHREAALMVAAGMTPYEVLRTGTVNVARFLGIEAEAGTVAVGKRADLLLLDGNPLGDIAAVSAIAGVVVDGRWLSREYLDQRLDALAARHAR